MQKTGKHFECGGFACSVWTEKADQFAFFDGETNMVHSERLFVTAMKKTTDGAT
jgi:hypothetical protein